MSGFTKTAFRDIIYAQIEQQLKGADQDEYPRWRSQGEEAPDCKPLRSKRGENHLRAGFGTETHLPVRIPGWPRYRP